MSVGKTALNINFFFSNFHKSPLTKVKKSGGIDVNAAIWCIDVGWWSCIRTNFDILMKKCLLNLCNLCAMPKEHRNNKFARSFSLDISHGTWSLHTSQDGTWSLHTSQDETLSLHTPQGGKCSLHTSQNGTSSLLQGVTWFLRSRLGQILSIYQPEQNNNFMFSTKILRDLLFHMVTNRNNAKGHHEKRNQFSAEIRKNENTMAKELISANEDVTVTHKIGERPWRSTRNVHSSIELSKAKENDIFKAL